MIVAIRLNMLVGTVMSLYDLATRRYYLATVCAGVVLAIGMLERSWRRS